MTKITCHNIFLEAGKGNLRVLEHDLVDKIKYYDQTTPLHVLALKINDLNLSDEDKVKIVSHPSIDIVKRYDENDYDEKGVTALEILTERGVMEVLDHPNVEKKRGRFETDTLVYDLIMSLGWEMTDNHVEKFLDFHGIDRCYNKDSSSMYSPLRCLSQFEKIKGKHLKKKYPWFRLKKHERVRISTIDRLFNTPNSAKFIMEKD